MNRFERGLDNPWMGLAAGVLALVIVAIPVAGSASHLAAQISQTQLAERLSSGDAPVVVDVRSPQEFHSGHVPGAVNVPVQELQGHLSELQPYRNTELVLYCEAGPRALYAGHVLAQQGFTEVRILSGHMSAWREAGLPAEK